MGFLIPSALALAALAIPIIIFYMLKLRRQPRRVSSLMLWQQVLQDRQANAPWQRLKRNLLLLLQLLILALLVMALARPFFTVEASVQGNVVILLDASASMQATDVAPSRFAQAKLEAQQVIDRLRADDAVTLIAVESTPRVLASASTDHAALSRALQAAQVSNGPADWESALTLAAANAATLPEATVVILSDGATGSLIPEQLSAVPAPVEGITIGETGSNQGLVALALRDGQNGPELFLRAANAAPEPVRRLVEVRVDGQLLDARWLDLPANDSASLTLSGLPLNTRRVEARLSGSDALSADDTAWAVRSAAPSRILLVGPGNLFVERALALLPGVSLQRATLDQPLPETAFDLVIFDRVDPATVAPENGPPLPESHLLFIGPPVSTPLFEVSGTFTQTQISRIDTANPLVSYVRLNTVRIGQAQAVTPPSWSQTLIEANGGPLLIAGQTDRQRVAILTFDLHQSDLPLQIDFPILMVNLARWLLPGENLAQRKSLTANDRFDLPTAATADRLLIRQPNGAELTLPSDQAGFDQTGQLGVYQIYAALPDQAEPALVTEFAVNLLDETETNLQPQPIIAQTEAGPVAAGPALTGQIEWWWPLVLLGLAVLLIEWWVYWRGEVR